MLSKIPRLTNILKGILLESNKAINRVDELIRRPNKILRKLEHTGFNPKIATAPIKAQAKSRGGLPYISGEPNTTSLKNNQITDTINQNMKKPAVVTKDKAIHEGIQELTENEHVPEDIAVNYSEGIAGRGAEGREKTGEINRETDGVIGARKATGVGTTGEGIPVEEVKPEVLKQIHLDDNAAYGYSPNEGSRYAKYDFTEVEKAKENRLIREEYLAQSEKIQDQIDNLVQKGVSKEQIADEVVNMRNQDKVAARANMTPEAVAELEAGNMKIYKDPVGPDAKWLFNDKMQKMQIIGLNPTDEEVWDSVIKGSMKKDDVINTLLGIKH